MTLVDSPDILSIVRKSPQPRAVVRSPREVAQVLDRFALDRTSPVPLYFQVAKVLEDAIVGGQLPPGSELDNEIRLADALGLSRPTMRQAMEYLVDRGLIVRRRGIGTRVVQPKVRRSLELTSLYEDLSESGQKPTTEVLSNTVEDASPRVAEALGLVEGTPVVCLVRRRTAGDLPIAKMTNYLPGRIEVTTEELERGGLYQLIRAAGVTLHAATQTIGARNATAEEARLLGERKGAALLTMERTAYDDRGVAVEFGSHIYVASRYSFEMSLLNH